VKQIVMAAALAISVSSAAFAADLGPPTGVIVPAGTAVRFHLTAPVSSDRSKTGDRFVFTTIDPIVIGGQVIVGRGAAGGGVVVLAGHNGTGGHEGDLTLRLDSVTSLHHGVLAFSNQVLKINGRNRKVMSSVLGFIPTVGFASTFIRGQEIHIEPATPVRTVLVNPAVEHRLTHA
jgi:opacity protein-like surface antigen